MSLSKLTLTGYGPSAGGLFRAGMRCSMVVRSPQNGIRHFQRGFSMGSKDLDSKVSSIPREYFWAVDAAAKDGRFIEALESQRIELQDSDVGNMVLLATLATPDALEEAYELAMKMSQENCIVDKDNLNLLISFLLKGERRADARRVLASAKGKEDRSKLWRRVIKSMEDAGETDLVKWTKKEMMEKFKENPPSLEEQVWSEAERGNWEQIEKIFQHWEHLGRKPRHIHWRYFLKACVVAKNDSAYENGLRRMKAAGNKVSQRDYFFLLKLISYKLDAAAADRVLEKMKEDEIAPNDIIITLVASVYFKTKDLGESERRLKELQDEYRIVPSVRSMNTVIVGYSQSGDQKGAMEAFERMKKLKLAPNVFTYNCLMTGPARAGDLETTEEIFTMIADAGISPSEVTMGLLIQAMAMSGEFQRAEKFFSSMQDRFGITPRIAHSNLLIDAFASSGTPENLERAEKLLSSLDRRNFRSYMPLIREYGRQKKLDELKEIIARMGNECGTSMPKWIFISVRNSFEMAKFGTNTSTGRLNAQQELQIILRNSARGNRDYLSEIV